MKNLFFLTLYLHVFSFCFSQVSTEGLRDEFSETAKYATNSGTGYEGLQSFSSKNITGSQFYFPNWTLGSIITPANETTATNFLFLYDKVRQVVFMKAKDSAEVMELSKNKIHGFTLSNNGTHNFVLASDYNPDNTTDFYEVLLKNDSMYTLLKSVKTKYVKFDPTDMIKMKSGNTNDEFDDDITYYVSYKHGSLQAIKLKDNSIKKVLEADKNKVNNYINTNYDSERNESFLINLISSLND